MARRQKQYTIRNVPEAVDQALRRRARKLGRSLNQIALEALAREAGESEPVKRRDLSWFAGSWVEDPEFDRVIADFRKIDRKLWK